MHCRALLFIPHVVQRLEKNNMSIMSLLVPYEATHPTGAPLPEWWTNLTESEKRIRLKLLHGQIGRNDSCPCGSEKKYKKCCIDKQLSSAVKKIFEE